MVCRGGLGFHGPLAADADPVLGAPRSGLPVLLSPLGHPGMEVPVPSLSSLRTLVMALASCSPPQGLPFIFKSFLLK